MAEVNLVLFLTVDVGDHPLGLMIETQEKGIILDAEATDRLLDAVRDVVQSMPDGASVTSGDV